jgi:hypothetical protein
MTTQERAAIYEHCARLVERLAHDRASIGEIVAAIRQHKADSVKYP